MANGSEYPELHHANHLIVISRLDRGFRAMVVSSSNEVSVMRGFRSYEEAKRWAFRFAEQGNAANLSSQPKLSPHLMFVPIAGQAGRTSVRPFVLR